MAHFWSLLSDSKHWDMIPPVGRTIAQCGLACRLINVRSGRIQSRFVEHHQAFPYKTFKLLTGELTAPELAAAGLRGLRASGTPGRNRC